MEATQTRELSGEKAQRIVEAMRAAGVGAAGVEEHQPTFDEVFTGLVEQRRGQRNGGGDDG